MSNTNFSKLIELNKRPKNYLNSVGDRLSKICSPLFKNLGIRVFCYTRTYPNGDHLFLDSNSSWRNDWFEQNMYLDISHHDRLLGIHGHKDNTKVIWNNEPDSDVYSTMREKHNMWNGLSVSRNREKYIETWHFSAERDEENIFTTYIEEAENLERFVKYFKAQANEIIENSIKNNLLIKTPFSETHLKKVWCLIQSVRVSIILS